MYTFGKGDLLSGVQGVDFGCTKSKDKGKSQAGGLGTGCRSRGPNQDKSLVFAIVIFFCDLISFYCKYFISVTLISLFEC